MAEAIRKFNGDTLVIATHNAGKAREFATLLTGKVAHCPTASGLDLPEPDETEATFAGNAALKARFVANATGLPALADDSGLCVDALDGAPGIYSARWAGPGKDFEMAMRRVLDGIPPDASRSAAFVCALALAWPDGHIEATEGTLIGRIGMQPRGLNGFGYDPIFIPEGMTLTLAEVEPGVKDSISHRAIGTRLLLRRVFYT